MGDGADMALDSMMSQDALVAHYEAGEMSEAEAYNLGLIDEFGALSQVVSGARVCRNCGRGDLHWMHTKHGWRLFNSHEHIHRCPVVPLPPEEY